MNMQHDLVFRYYPLDGSLGVNYSPKEPEALFAKGFPAKVLLYILQEVQKGRYHFTIREFRLNPAFKIEPGTHNISSRVHVVRERLTQLNLPFTLERGQRGEFSVLIRKGTTFKLEIIE